MLYTCFLVSCRLLEWLLQYLETSPRYDFVPVAQAWARNVQAGKLSKGDRLGPADHSKIDYPPFRRNFYIEVPELARMSEEAVAERRKELDGIKVRSSNSNDKCKYVFI